MEKRYRVTWEMLTPYSGDKWHLTKNEGDESVLDQYRQLKEWSETSEEPIRNVQLFELTVEARPINPFPAVPAGRDRFA